jgi:hypothetical protein
VEKPDELWELLSQEIRDRVDGELRGRRRLQAIVVARNEGGLDPTPSLLGVQLMVEERFHWLIERGEVKPRPTVEIPELIAKARALPAPVAAIEAVWDGDSAGWHVMLLAIVDRPSHHHRRFDERMLARFVWGYDTPRLDGGVRPDAAEAIEKGGAVAAALGVPFHFADPDNPDDELPRWWDGVPPAES